MDSRSFDVIDGIKTYRLFMDGGWVASSRNALDDSINPATGKLFARTHQAGAEEVARAIDAAEAASVIWGNTTASEREKALLRIGEVISSRTSEIRDMDSEEALKVANDTKYGLSAAVLTQDVQKAMDLFGIRHGSHQ